MARAFLFIVLGDLLGVAGASSIPLRQASSPLLAEWNLHPTLRWKLSLVLGMKYSPELGMKYSPVLDRKYSPELVGISLRGR